MPRFFDDYSNTYLTHDSAAGRKQQRRGWKFRENFRLHYEEHLPEWRRGPMGLASAQQDFLRARGAEDSAVPPLPEGWKEEADDVTGIAYYVDTSTGKRTWVRPGFIPPPPGGGGGPMGMNRGPGGMNRGPPPPQFRGPPPPRAHGPPPPGNYPPPPGNYPPPPHGHPPPPPHGHAPPGYPPPVPPPPNLQFPPPGPPPPGYR